MRTSSIAAPLALAALLGASEARADLVVAGSSGGGSSSGAGASSSGTEFYGWINILIGEVSVGATLGFAALLSLSDGGGGGEAGLAGAIPLLSYTLGGPIVHSVKGSFPKSLVALGLLVGMPATGAIIGYAASDGCTADGCRAEATAWSAVGGAVAAPLVDGLALGWRDSTGSTQAASFVAPIIAPTAGGATFGLVGRF